MTDIDTELDDVLSKHLQDIRAGHDSILKQQLHHLLARVAREARIDEMQSLKNQTRKWYDNRAMIYVESQNQSMAVHTNSLIEYRLATLQKEANHE